MSPAQLPKQSRANQRTHQCLIRVLQRVPEHLTVAVLPAWLLSPASPAALVTEQIPFVVTSNEKSYLPTMYFDFFSGTYV